MGFTHVDKNLPFARAEGRIATKSYGIPKYITFDDSEHERVRRWVAVAFGPRCRVFAK